MTAHASAGQQAVHQVGGAVGLVFAHEAGAVDFHRAVADGEGFTDFFAGQAVHEQGGDFAFAGGEFGADGAV